MVGILVSFIIRNTGKYFLLLTIFGFSFQAYGQSFYFKSHQTGNWNAPATWESSPNGVTWTTPAVTTPGAAVNNSTSVLILSGHTVTISAAIANPVKGGTNIGTVTVQGTLTGTRSINFGGTTLDNQGTINLTAGTVTVSGTPFSITSGGGTPSTSLNALTIANGTTVTTGIAFTTSGALMVGAVGGAASLITNAGITANGAVTISGTGSSIAANNAPISVAGALTVSMGNTFTTDNSASAILNGNLTASGTFTSNAPVTFSGVATQTLAGMNAIFNSDVIVTNTSANGLAGGGSPTFKGNLINNGIIGFTGGTISFSGASPQTISGASSPTTKFNSLTISSGSAVTVDVTIPTIQIAGTSLAATGTFTSNAPVIFNRVGATALTGTGASFNSDVSVTLGTTLNGAGSFAMNGSQLANDGTITSTGTVTFGSSTGTTLITTTAPKTFSFATIVLNNNVTLGSSGITLKSSSVSPVAGLTLNSGTLNLSGGTLTVGTGLISVTSGVIDATVASIVMIGATGTVTGTMAFTDGSSLTNFKVARSMTIQGDVTVSTLVLNTGGTVVTQSSGTFTIANNGSITSAGGKLSLASPIIAAGVYDLSYNIAAGLTTGDELSSTSSAIHDFTKAGTSMLKLNKDLTVNNTFSLSAGTLGAGGNAVTLNGTTATIDGTAVSNFAALNVNGPLTKSSTGTTTITGDVTLGTGGSIDFSTGGATTFTTNTTLSNVGSGSIAFNALNVTTTAGALTASAPFSVAGVFMVTSPGSFTANVGADVTLSNNLAGSGAFTSNAGVTFNNLTTISNSGTKIFTDIMVSGTVNVTTNVTSKVNGNLVNDGTINCSGGTWIFSGNPKTISGTPTATNFFNLTVKNGASITISIPFTTAGALNIVAASGTAGVANLTTTAGFTANAAVNVFGTGSNFNANAGAFSVTGGLALGMGNFFTIGAASTGTLSSDLTANGTFNNNGTLTAGANLTGTGTLKQGTNATLNIGGTATVTNLSATAAGNTVNYTGSAQTVRGVNYYNLGLKGTASTAVGLTIAGDLTIGSGATFSAGAFMHNVGGNWTNNGTFAQTGGTVVLNGSGLQTIGGVNSTTFYNLNLTGGTKSFGISTTIGGLLAISTGAQANLLSLYAYTAGTLSLGGAAQTSGIYGSFSSAAPPPNQSNYFSGDGVVIVDNNIFYSIATGSWDAAATWSTGGHNGTAGSAYPQAGDIAVIGNGNTVTVNGTQAGEVLSFDGAGNLSIGAGATLAVSGDITGTGTSTSSFVVVASTGLLQVGGTLSSASGTFTPGLPANSTVEFNGNVDQTIPVFAYGNLTLSGNSNKNMAASFNIGGNLIINNGATFPLGAVTTTVTGSTTVNGTLNITSTNGTKTFGGLVTINSGGTWNNSANEGFTFRGGITNNGGTFNAGASSGTYSFTTSAQALTGTLIIPTITVTAVTLTNNDVLTVGTMGGSGTLAQATNAVLNIGGTSSGITTLDASAAGNTVNYTRATAQTVHTGNYYNLNLSGGGAKTLQAGTTAISGNLSLSGTVSTTGVVGLAIGGDVNIGSGTSFTSGAFTHNVGGNWTNNGTFTHSGGTVVFTGAGTAIGGGNTTFNNLTLNGSGTVTVTSPQSVSSTLTLTSGVLSISSNNLAISPDAMIVIDGGSISTSSPAGGPWNLTYLGLDKGTGLEIPGSGIINNITISLNASQTVTLGSAVKLTGLLNITNDNNTLQSSGNLTLVSTATNTASIGSLAGTARTVSGNVNVQRYIAAAGRVNHNISSPVAGPSVHQIIASGVTITGPFTDTSYPCAGCPGNNASFLYYKESVAGSQSNGFVGYPPTGASSTGTFLAVGSGTNNAAAIGRGYTLLIRNELVPASPTITLTGAINTAVTPITLPVSYTPTSGGLTEDGWNHVGNPLPSAIDWDAPTGWTRPTGIQGGYVAGYGQINVYDPVKGGYRTWNGQVGDLGSGRIAQGQGFWVKLNSAGGSLSITEDVKTNTQGSFLRVKADDIHSVEVILLSPTVEDRAYIQKITGAKAIYDPLDGAKLHSPEGVNLSTLTADKAEVSINAIGEVIKKGQVPLYISNIETGTYTLSQNSMGDFEGVKIWLMDQFTNTINDLDPGKGYSFSVSEDAKSKDPGRFTLVFGDHEDLKLETSINLYPNPTSEIINIMVNNSSQESPRGDVFDTMGNYVGTIIWNQESGNNNWKGVFNVGQQTSGMYIAKIWLGPNVHAIKFIKH